MSSTSLSFVPGGWDILQLNVKATLASVAFGFAVTNNSPDAELNFDTPSSLQFESCHHSRVIRRHGK
ncbi:MAG TPA: hypothetical protein VF074_10260 [Pyrinomonadaceae bacterium]